MCIGADITNWQENMMEEEDLEDMAAGLRISATLAHVRLDVNILDSAASVISCSERVLGSCGRRHDRCNARGGLSHGLQSSGNGCS